MYLHTENGCIHKQEFHHQKPKVFIPYHHICHLQNSKLQVSHLYGNKSNTQKTLVDQESDERGHHYKTNLLDCRKIRSKTFINSLLHSKLLFKQSKASCLCLMSTVKFKIPSIVTKCQVSWPR